MGAGIKTHWLIIDEGSSELQQQFAENQIKADLRAERDEHVRFKLGRPWKAICSAEISLDSSLRSFKSPKTVALDLETGLEDSSCKELASWVSIAPRRDVAAVRSRDSFIAQLLLGELSTLHSVICRRFELVMSWIHGSNTTTCSYGFEARRRTCRCVNFGSRVSSLLSENVRKQTKTFLSVTLDRNRQTFQTSHKGELTTRNQFVAFVSITVTCRAPGVSTKFISWYPAGHCAAKK